MWQDRNQDGISQTGELKTLSELGMTALSLDTIGDGSRQNGNTLRSTASFTRADGSSGTIGSLDLAASRFFTDYGDTGAGDAGLPEMHGSGAVRNLRAAADGSPSLASLLTQYSAGDRATQVGMLDQLLDAWAATSGMPSMVQRAQDAGYLVLYEFGNNPAPSDQEVQAVITGSGSGGNSGPS